MANDLYPGQLNILASAVGGFAVTPNDDNELAHVSRALWIGGDGDLTVQMHGNETLTFANVQAGSLLPFRVKKVLSTGTTASDIVAVF